MFALGGTLLTLLSVSLIAFWIGPAWDAFSGRYLGNLRPEMLAAGLSESQVHNYLQTWGYVLCGTAIVFGLLLRMPPVAAGLLYIVFVAPRFFLAQYVARRKRLLRDQLVRASSALANSVRAGMAFVQGLELLCDDTPEPLRSELQRIVNEYHSGRPLAESLRDAQQRLDIEAFTVFATAMLVCMERGGKVTFALERISANLQELQRLERKLEADTASGRKLAILLSAFPFAFMALFTLLDPSSMSNLYNTLIGQFVLLGVGVIVYLSALWCQKILTMEA